MLSFVLKQPIINTVILGPIPGMEECALICAPECEDTELKCSGGTSPGGCKENDYCHPKGTGDNGEVCPGYCPVDCEETEHKCPVPDDPITGCAVPPLCPPKAKDHTNDYCGLQQCPLLCDPESEIFCPGKTGADGCKAEDTCLQKCVSTCPVECGDDEITCAQQSSCEDGCLEDVVCKPAAKDVNGNACPQNSDSHGCPISCCNPLVQCPAENGALGCLDPATCVDPTKKTDEETGMEITDEDGNPVDCPLHSHCPTVCKPNEVKCEVTETDHDGCKLPDECITQDRDHEGQLCTVHCKIICDEDETFCPGQRNEKGCLEPDQCIKRAIKTTGSDKGGLCPGWCPPICQHGEVKCPSQVDPCDGCPTEEICVPAARDLNREFCPESPSLSDSHGCPILCDEIHGEVLCPTKMLASGCKEEAKCMPRDTDDDGQYCPAHSVCPEICADDEIACNYGIDARGCQEATICRARGKDKDLELCPGVCPPSCSGDETLVTGGVDDKGCEIAPSCVIN